MSQWTARHVTPVDGRYVRCGFGTDSEQVPTPGGRMVSGHMSLFHIFQQSASSESSLAYIKFWTGHQLQSAPVPSLGFSITQMMCVHGLKVTMRQAQTITRVVI